MLPGLTFGGAERVIFTLCNELNRDRFEPVLVLFSKEGMPIEFLKADVKVIDLKISRIRKSVFSVINLIRKDKPDIVFGGWGEVSALLSPIVPLFRKTKFVARETNVVSHHVNRSEIRFLYRFYNNFDQIIAQSDDMQNDLIENWNVKPSKIVKINNPVDIEMIQSKMKTDKQLFSTEFKNVIAIGNLTNRKGFDLLLDVFEKLKNEPIRLYILGDGSDREKLLTKKENLGLDKVEFSGIKKNPFPYLYQSDLFVLSSRYEGFPNVLLEAGVCGTYSLVNDCPGGITEIIRETVNGEICEITQIEKFSEKIKELVSLNFDKESISESIRSRFSKEIIIGKYEKLFENL
ncbi:MAG: glycosyltransferase [Weeksellaceae bacterium]